MQSPARLRCPGGSGRPSRRGAARHAARLAAGLQTVTGGRAADCGTRGAGTPARAAPGRPPATRTSSQPSDPSEPSRAPARLPRLACPVRRVNGLGGGDCSCAGAPAAVTALCSGSGALHSARRWAGRQTNAPPLASSCRH